MPIVISDALVLAGVVDDIPLTHARILFDDIFGLSDTTLVASSEATGFPKENAADYLTFDSWQPTAMPATLEAQAGAAHAIDYVMIAAHSLGTVGAGVKPQYWDGAAWVDLAIEVAPGTDRVLLFLFEEVTASRVRIRATGSGDMPNLGVVMAGKALAMERGQTIQHTPIPYARKTTFSINTSEAGQFLGRSVRRQGIELPLRFDNLTKAWVDTNFEPFVTHHQNKGFFGVAPAPVDDPNDVAYGTCAVDIHPAHEDLPDRLNVEFTMMGMRT